MLKQIKYWMRSIEEALERLETSRMTSENYLDFNLETEKDIVVYFYVIRKIITHPQLQICKHLCRLQAHACIKHIDWFANIDMHSYYDFDKFEVVNLDATYICNLVVHSYILCPTLDADDRFSGFYVCSDKTKDKYMHFMSVVEIKKLFNSAIGDCKILVHTKDAS